VADDAGRTLLLPAKCYSTPVLVIVHVYLLQYTCTCYSTYVLYYSTYVLYYSTYVL